MALVQFRNVSVSFGESKLLSEISFGLNEGQTVGLIGANGTGKTTVLRLIAGMVQPDSGLVERKRGLRIGFVEQEPAPLSDANVHDAALSAFSELLQIEKQMREFEHEISLATGERQEELLKKLGRAQGEFEHAGGYDRESRAAAALMGLGFERDEFMKPVSALSGGERTRISLARLLLQDADLLLLDEPTNHLDLSGIEWLEGYIRKKSSVSPALIVSHDRLFLDRTVEKIIELDSATVTEFLGNYSHYADVADARKIEQQRRHALQQEFIEKEKDFIRRHHADQRSKEARGRQKRLDRVEIIEAPEKQKRISVRFDPADEHGDICVRADAISKSFGGRALFSDLSFEVYRGERVGIIGPNGCGKTTLLKILLGMESADEGKLYRGPSVGFGWLEQAPATLESAKSVLDAIWDLDRTQDEVEARSLLGRFQFRGDEAVGKKLCDLSGGERTRIELARLMLERPNALALDEPTNHLDIASRVALERALEDYSGTIIVVSHDRYFINKVVKRLIVLDAENGPAKFVLGNYEKYEELRAAEAAAATPRSPERAAKEKKRARGLSKNRLAQLEREISELEAEKVRLEEELARPEIYADPVKARETPKLYRNICDNLDALYKEWTDNAPE